MAKMNYGNDFGKHHNQGHDEWRTPVEAVKPILKFLKPNSRVLCPFDMSDSFFVKILKFEGHQVEHSHISEGKDFFKLEKPDVDYIVSNPPFSQRDAILKKLYEWRVPFAMIFNTNGLFDSRNRLALAKEYGAEVLYMSPRVKFIDPDGVQNAPPFQSCYWCYKVLPEQLMFEFI